jgi:hypothetical protein
MMTTAQLQQRWVSDEEVIRCRCEQLRNAGYDRRDADLLSSRADIDLHRAVELVQRGCSHELALSILL